MFIDFITFLLQTNHLPPLFSSVNLLYLSLLLSSSIPASCPLTGCLYTIWYNINLICKSSFTKQGKCATDSVNQQPPGFTVSIACNNFHYTPISEGICSNKEQYHISLWRCLVESVSKSNSKPFIILVVFSHSSSHYQNLAEGSKLHVSF